MSNCQYFVYIKFNLFLNDFVLSFSLYVFCVLRFTMLYRFLLVFTALILSVTNGLAASPWEGKWEYGRYIPSIGGGLTIKNCSATKCQFDLGSYHGAHTCWAEGEIILNGNKGRFFNKASDFDRQNLGVDADEELEFELDANKRIIHVTRISGRFCGMRGVLEGDYEYESLPYRYKTSFDCWAKDLTAAEKTVCSDTHLAKADMEFAINYPSGKTPEWFETRNKCGENKPCLWKFYKNAILMSYIKAQHEIYNLYDYTQNQKQKWFYPTDLVLFHDFFLKSMDKKYYDAWVVSLDDDSYTLDCDNCLAKSYGVAGMYKIYESAVYVDNQEVWLAFVSANLPKPEDKNIIVFAPKGKTLNDMPKTIKDFTDYLVGSGFYNADSLKLIPFKTQSVREKLLDFLSNTFSFNL